MPACSAHPKYTGLRKYTSKGCEECVGIFAAQTGARARYAKLKSARTKLKTFIKGIAEFKVGSDDHWRWLLFDKAALGLRPVSFTPKKQVPRVDDDAVEKLARRHPEIPLLKYRYELQRARHRLSHTLAVEPEPDGRVHFDYSLHRTSYGRAASGSDSAEPDKIRVSDPAQNIPDRDRKIYVAPPGGALVHGDYSQIELRLVTWRAQDRDLLAALAKGDDVHGINAVDLAQRLCKARSDARTIRDYGWVKTWEDTKIAPPLAGRGECLRDSAKILTHGWDYGLGDVKAARDFGLPVAVMAELRRGFFGRWKGLARNQAAIVEEAERARRLINSFGRKFRIFGFKFNHESGKWELEDREDALAFHGQSEAGDIIKAVLPAADGLPDGKLVTTTHDSLTWEIADAARVATFVSAARTMMEREWSEWIPRSDEFGPFVCPADFSVGGNWGKRHAHTPECLARGCAREENPVGLEKWPGEKEEGDAA